MRILAYLPLPFDRSDGIFWHRDVGLLVTSLRELGHDARLVLHGQSAAAPDDGAPLLLIPPGRTQDSAWWKAAAPDAIVSNTWGRRKFRATWDAMRAATPRIIERLDTEGTRSPRIEPLLYLYLIELRFLDYWKQHGLRALPQLARDVAHFLAPGPWDRPVAEGLSRFQGVTAECPVAAQRIRRLLTMYGFAADNVHCVPHPVNESHLPALSADPRARRVVSVGRWDARQKNFPLLLGVLDRFLAAHADWDALVVGQLPGAPERWLARHCRESRGRICLTGNLPHAEVYEEMAKSRVFLMSSRGETFGIAAAEALCCGCSVVGPHHIASVPWFCGSDSGTVATLYTGSSLLDALSAEAAAWEMGQRDAARIASSWRARVGSTAVAHRFIHLFAQEQLR